MIQLDNAQQRRKKGTTIMAGQNTNKPNIQYLGVNTEVTVDGDFLMLKIDLRERNGATSTANSEMVSSTGGYQYVPGHPDLKVSAMVIKPYPKQR